MTRITELLICRLYISRLSLSPISLSVLFNPGSNPALVLCATPLGLNGQVAIVALFFFLSVICDEGLNCKLFSS